MRKVEEYWPLNALESIVFVVYYNCSKTVTTLIKSK